MQEPAFPSQNQINVGIIGLQTQIVGQPICIAVAQTNGNTHYAGMLGAAFALLVVQAGLILAGRSWLAAILVVLIPFVMTVIVVVLTIRNFRRLNRQLYFAEGFCCNCGYDLCESPERCPECGTPADQNEA